MKGKEKIEWVKQPVPKFIQEFKERTNQIEGPTLESKHKTDNVGEGDDKERDDETPLVCINSSDISQEEAESFIKQSYGDKADVRIEDPKKRSLDDDAKESMLYVFVIDDLMLLKIQNVIRSGLINISSLV